MPEVPHQPDTLPITDTRQERIHQNDLADLSRILGRIGIGHHQTDVVPDDAHLTKVKLAHKFPNVLCHALLVVPALRTLRVTGTAQIGGDHSTVFSEHR